MTGGVSVRKIYEILTHIHFPTMDKSITEIRRTVCEEVLRKLSNLRTRGLEEDGTESVSPFVRLDDIRKILGEK
jgi:hypothetical protein